MSRNMEHCIVTSWQDEGTMCDNHLFCGHNKSSVAEEAEGYFKAIVMEDRPATTEEELAVALDDGWIDLGGGPCRYATISWPDITCLDH